jgi:hypothetical protein
MKYLTIIFGLLLIVGLVGATNTFSYSHRMNPDAYNVTVKSSNGVLWYMNYTFNEFELWSLNKTTLPIIYSPKYGWNTTGTVANHHAFVRNLTLPRWPSNNYFYNNRVTARFNLTFDMETILSVRVWNGGWVDIGGTTNGDVITGVTCGSGVLSNPATYVFDNLLTTNAVFNGGIWSYTDPTAVACDYGEVRLFDESLYVPVADNSSIIFTIKNEFGQYVQNARVIIRGSNAGTLVFNSTTDISGNIRAELIDDYYYNVSVVKQGYQTFSGLLHVLTNSYTISIISNPNILNPFTSIYRHVSLITSPTGNPYANMTQFTIDVTSDDAYLGTYGINVSVNGVDYHNASNYLFIDFANLAYKNGSVKYWFNYNGTTYMKAKNFIINPLKNNSNTLTGVVEDVVSDMSTEAKYLIAVIFIIIIIAIMGSVGIPGEFFLLPVALMIIMFAVLGVINPIFGGILVTVGVLFMITFHRGGSSS